VVEKVRRKCWLPKEEIKFRYVKIHSQEIERCGSLNVKVGLGILSSDKEQHCPLARSREHRKTQTAIIYVKVLKFG
jgi:hypothetical protein